MIRVEYKVNSSWYTMGYAGTDTEVAELLEDCRQEGYLVARAVRCGW